MVVSLLRYANREAVAQALTEHGYSVTRQTVNRWARGDEIPEIAARMIGELFGHTEGHEEAALPEWARRLLVVSEAARQRMGVSDSDLARAEADLIARRVLGANAEPRRGGSGGAAGGSSAAG